MSVCLCECLACLCGCLQKLKRGDKSPETGVVGVVGHLIWVLVIWKQALTAGLSMPLLIKIWPNILFY